MGRFVTLGRQDTHEFRRVAEGADTLAGVVIVGRIPKMLAAVGHLVHFRQIFRLCSFRANLWKFMVHETALRGGFCSFVGILTELVKLSFAVCEATFAGLFDPFSRDCLVVFLLSG